MMGQNPNEIGDHLHLEGRNGDRKKPGKFEVLTLGDWEGGGPKKVDGRGLGKYN